MRKPINWGIIGCGNVVLTKSGPSILKSGNSRIVAVMRRNPEQARSFAEKNDIPVCTDDPWEVVRNPEVDIVYIATPPVSHREFVLAAASAGKHVLVEKPMGMSTKEDDEMIAACLPPGSNCLRPTTGAFIRI